MYNITIQNAFFMAKFIVAIVLNTFVTVEEIAKFLNIIFGTKTITADSVNNMLVQTKYQIPTDEEEFHRLQKEDESIIYTKYLILDKAEGLYKLEVPKNDEEDCYFKWNTYIIPEMFEFETCSSYEEVARKMTAKAIQYNLINLDIEFIDIETVKLNLVQLLDVVSLGIENYTEE